MLSVPCVGVAVSALSQPPGAFFRALACSYICHVQLYNLNHANDQSVRRNLTSVVVYTSARYLQYILASLLTTRPQLTNKRCARSEVVPDIMTCFEQE